jgi:hypothetical protein
MREHDLTFGPREKLWRRVCKGDLRGGAALKGNKLRLQISVIREKHGAIDSVPQGDRTGVAEVEALQAAEVSKLPIRVECVDDPMPTEDGHALIALVAKPGEETSQDMINATREILAGYFSVRIAPTR